MTTGLHLLTSMTEVHLLELRISFRLTFDSDYRAYDKYERDYYDRVQSRHYPTSSSRDYPASSRDYDRYYDPRDRYYEEKERYYEDRYYGWSYAGNLNNNFRYGYRYGPPPSRTYYDRPESSRRDYPDPREYERWYLCFCVFFEHCTGCRYERYPAPPSSRYSGRRSRSPLPPTRRGY